MRRLIPFGARHLRIATLLLAAISWTAVAQDGAKDPASLHQRGGPNHLPPITTTVSGAIQLAKDQLVALEYADSPKLTELLRRSLSGEGFRVVQPDAQHAVFVRVRGVLQLTGKHTARIRVAELAEKGTLVESADAPRTLALADVGYVIAAGDWLGRLVQWGQLAAPVGGVLLLDIVGQATGAKDWFNRAVGGDRRGICLINCEHWHKTRQAAYQVIELQDGAAAQRVEIRSELLAEDLQPGRVVSAGLAALIQTLAGKPPPAPAASGNDHASAPD
jgi:hypothetical protein